MAKTSTPYDPQVRGEAAKVGFFTVVLLFLGSKVFGLAWWLAKQWPLWALLALWWAATRLLDVSGTWATVGIAAGLLAALIGWRLLRPTSFRMALVWPLRAWWRRLFVYQREWQPAMVNCRLTMQLNGDLLMPRILSVRSTATVDKVRVRMLPGQKLADFGKVADRLAATFEALDCRVRSIPRRSLFGKGTGRPSRVLELWFLVEDPLTELVPLFDVPARPNLKALPLAKQEDGLPWALRLLATHVLIVGATGAGKGSVLWSLVRALGPLIRARLVEVWVIDPKGGMELAAGERLFARFCYGDEDTDDEGRRRAYELAFAEFLEDAVDKMRDVQRRYRGIFRTHKASVDDPHRVIIIDELANLTAYVVDREAKKRIESALNLLLSQGRAGGFTVVAALQDPRKDVLPARGLFPTRIALRMSEADEVDMVLGGGQRDKGARCDEISEDTPGVGFVSVDGRTEPIRIRFAYVDDEEIATMCSLYAPGSITAGDLDAELAALLAEQGEGPGNAKAA